MLSKYCSDELQYIREVIQGSDTEAIKQEVAASIIRALSSKQVLHAARADSQRAKDLVKGLAIYETAVIYHETEDAQAFIKATKALPHRFRGWKALKAFGFEWKPKFEVPGEAVVREEKKTRGGTVSIEKHQVENLRQEVAQLHTRLRTIEKRIARLGELLSMHSHTHNGKPAIGKFIADILEEEA